MMEKDDRSRTELADSKPGYEAPEVESVLTPEELERQVHYAGNGASPLTPL